MNIEGYCLIFDEPRYDGRVIPNDCKIKIRYAEIYDYKKIPVIFGYMDYVVGSGRLVIDDIGVKLSADIEVSQYVDPFMNDRYTLSFGANRVEYAENTIQSMNITYAAIVAYGTNPAGLSEEKCKIKIVNEEE